MPPRQPDPDRIAQVLREQEATIARHGWIVQAVFPTEEAPGPHFAYTVGLHDRGQPELLVIGLPGRIAHLMLNEVGALMCTSAEKGQPLPAGRLELTNWTYPAWLVPARAADAAQWATGAYSRSRGQATYLQLCFPDQAGLFPWEPGCDARLVHAQPLLGDPVPR